LPAINLVSGPRVCREVLALADRESAQHARKQIGALRLAPRGSAVWCTDVYRANPAAYEIMALGGFLKLPDADTCRKRAAQARPNGCEPERLGLDDLRLIWRLRSPPPPSLSTRPPIHPPRSWVPVCGEHGSCPFHGPFAPPSTMASGLRAIQNQGLTLQCNCSVISLQV